MAGKYKCTVCGYILLGESSPERCPICKAEKSKFIDAPASLENLENDDFIESQVPIVELINLDVLKDVEWDYELGAFTVNISEIKPGESLEIFSMERDNLFYVLSGDGLVSSDLEIMRTIEITENPDLDDFSEDSDANDESDADENDLEIFESEFEEEEEEEDSEDDAMMSFEISSRDVFVLPVDERLIVTNTGEDNLVVMVIG